MSDAVIVILASYGAMLATIGALIVVIFRTFRARDAEQILYSEAFHKNFVDYEKVGIMRAEAQRRANDAGMSG